MKKFVLHILLFLLPLIAGWIMVVSKPIDKKRAYHYLTDDCEGRGAWMYRRIFESKKPIDIAFLGSSHTINGINDTLINQRLRDAGSTATTCNLGYCRLGRDLTYVLMKHLIDQKKTRIFIIEVMVDEYPRSHPVFPFLAETKEVLDPKTIFNTSYPSNLYSNSVAQWMYLRQNWMNEAYPYKYALRESYGFTTNTFEADTNLLNRKKETNANTRGKSKTWTRNINMPFPRAWLNEIGDLAKKNGCKIYFLYLPPYGSPEPLPIEAGTYSKYGNLWTLPDSLLNNKKNWYDSDHMNLQGANIASEIVAEKIFKIQ
jgi:hypothetical protein